MCKVLNKALAEIAAAAVPEITKQISFKIDAIFSWLCLREVVTDQSAWITLCPLELAALVSALTYPVADLAWMPRNILSL